MSSSSPSSPLVFYSISSSFLVNYLFFFLFLSSPFLLQLSATTNHSQHQTCVDEHFTALLDLKRGFNFTTHSESNLSSWNVNNRDNCCCSWEGVTCNAFTAHVIALDLSVLGLSGVLDFDSLFRLRTLQKLDLSFNEFRESPIPSGFHHLSSLTHLDLSSCNFVGEIPLDFSRLTKLVALDLSYNPLSSPVPHFIANLTSLTRLLLRKCDLHGEFPKSVFNLPGIQTIDFSSNPLLTGTFPEFSSNSSIQTLAMKETGFYGMLPRSLGNLKSLTSLELRNCNMSGPIPQSLGELSQLVHLDLSENSLSGPIPQSLGELSQLVYLDLSKNRLSGQMPQSLPNLTRLRFAHLSDNGLTGPIPSAWFSLPTLFFLYLSLNNFSSIEFQNLSSSWLFILDMHGNNFHGPIPKMILELTELQSLDLSLNNFSGVVDLGLFHIHKSLSSLDLSYNSFTAIIDTRDESMPTSFPQLTHLDLSCNEIGGKIPQWIWKVMRNDSILVSPSYLNLSHNAFEGIDGPLSLVSTSTRLVFLDLSFNKLKGLIPIPPPLCTLFSIGNNQFSGDVPSQICNATRLEFMDLSDNNFSGEIPKCLGGMSRFLSVLKLGGNNLDGTFLQAFSETCSLRTIGLNGNRLEGHLPESLANCKMLEVFDLGNNQIHDTFPVWLKDLPGLRVLVLRSNQFHGTLGYHPKVGDFPQLQIFDIAFNNFTGGLAPDVFRGWKAMMVRNESESLYLGVEITSEIYYEDTVTVVGKGNEMKLEKIFRAFTLLDLSNNRFEGSIPMSAGDLKSLHIINMSHNGFTGGIPASMGDIRNLESLDLSQNELSGEIPWQLGKIPWLAVLNLSQNLLVGPIPQGPQFKTFTNESFKDNLGLCGPPLSNMCDIVLPPPAAAAEAEKESEYDWECMWIAFGIGHGVGLGILFWTLALWRQGRIAFFTFADRMLSFLLPPAACSCLHHQHHPRNRTRNGKSRLKI